MNPEIKNLIKTFQSKSTGDGRFAEFLQHCYFSIKLPKKKSNNKRVINKYDILRQDLIRYLIANETAVKAELNK